MRMLRTTVVALVQAGIAVALFAGSAAAEARIAVLGGLDEVPVVITDASGRFRGVIASDEQSIEYSLNYEDIEGRVTQAHIHLGQQHTAGTIILWLCANTPPITPPPTIPTPPTCGDTASGRVAGTLTAADLLPAPAQGVTSLAGAIEAIRKGVSYVNVHTTISGSGAIRGQFPGKH